MVLVVEDHVFVILVGEVLIVLFQILELNQEKLLLVIQIHLNGNIFILILQVAPMVFQLQQIKLVILVILIYLSVETVIQPHKIMNILIHPLILTLLLIYLQQLLVLGTLDFMDIGLLILDLVLKHKVGFLFRI